MAETSAMHQNTAGAERDFFIFVTLLKRKSFWFAKYLVFDISYLKFA
jgi:hypothetical protein